ncbi:hypothetical protein SKAU_G00035390 [Synaphobranchus kaupii]|uniref:PPM-type phosphatase domain-containing protein n=1 Tax=Synaphobranchus kaupii TaxID=118154 RepID=A0A9Q1GFY7_SYNKA|nr:hypothetical protein SKAU_G00035390 [Synaphobranchus kaupii]
MRFFTEKKVQHESLVIGAIENAFKEMSVHVTFPRASASRPSSLEAAGDMGACEKYCRVGSGSRDCQLQAFTLDKEWRLCDAGNIFFRAYKTIEDDDLKFPLIYGEGKKARVMATIGVTRGLGDHDLKVRDSNIYIKPFLSCCPEVKVYHLSQYEHGPDDVLAIGTDGLWDVLSNGEVSEAVTSFLANCDPDDQHRYTMAAQDLVMRARGVLRDRGWRISNERLGSGDDISVYIIPLLHGNREP